MMNGLTNISDKILADAKQKADSIIDDAELAAAAILEDSKKRAATDIEAVLKLSAARCVDAEGKARLASQLEGKKLVSNERHKMISLAFSTALQRLTSLPENEYRKLLLSLASDVLSDGLGGELLLNERDHAAHGEALIAAINGAVTLAPDFAPIVGGLIIRRGKIEYNCALDVIVRMVSEKVAPEVSEALFSKGA